MLPLAERMRPRSLADIIGQKHLIGPGAPLQRVLQSGRLPSLIFWGPPGSGKTTMAGVLAAEIGAPFHSLSAIAAGVRDVREVIERAEKSDLFSSATPVLFIDEIHRFSKSQQDSLLGAVERGLIILIGATTENPSFSVINALLSRCQVYVLHGLEDQDMLELLNRTLAKDETLKNKKIHLRETTAMLAFASGDARKMLNLLEIITAGGEVTEITDEAVRSVVQHRAAMFDKAGEAHYDIISAFIKSIRGGDPNAAVYWLARMVEGGEDPVFIARRLVILASEDIGNANPTALVVASSCLSSVAQIGWPESRILLSQTAIYLASSPKSNSAYRAINEAQSFLQQHQAMAVPIHLRNAPTRLMKDLKYGAEYRYPHDFPGNFQSQEYLPEEMSGTRFYEPGENAREAELRERLKRWWSEKYGY